LRQQPHCFGPLWLIKRAEYLIQVCVASLGENSIYRVEIRRLEVFQPNYHWDMFLFGEVQEFPGHGNQS
jgi:hypothetical protein